MKYLFRAPVTSRSPQAMSARALSDLEWQLVLPVYWAWLFLGVKDALAAHYSQTTRASAPPNLPNGVRAAAYRKAAVTMSPLAPGARAARFNLEGAVRGRRER